MLAIVMNFNVKLLIYAVNIFLYSSNLGCLTINYTSSEVQNSVGSYGLIICYNSVKFSVWWHYTALL